MQPRVVVQWRGVLSSPTSRLFFRQDRDVEVLDRPTEKIVFDEFEKNPGVRGGYYDKSRGSRLSDEVRRYGLELTKVSTMIRMYRSSRCKESDNKNSGFVNGSEAH